MYLLELIPCGICGAVPGLAMCDFVFTSVPTCVVRRFGQRLCDLPFHASANRLCDAKYGTLSSHGEAPATGSRGLLRSSAVREPSLRLEAHVEAHIDVLNRMVLVELERQGLSRSV